MSIPKGAMLLPGEVGDAFSLAPVGDSHADMRHAFDYATPQLNWVTVSGAEQQRSSTCEAALPHWFVFGLWPLMRDAAPVFKMLTPGSLGEAALCHQRATYRKAALRCQAEPAYAEALWMVWLTAWHPSPPPPGLSTAAAHDMVREFVLATCPLGAQGDAG